MGSFRMVQDSICCKRMVACFFLGNPRRGGIPQTPRSSWYLNPRAIFLRPKDFAVLRYASLLSRVWLLATPWTAAHQAAWGFSVHGDAPGETTGVGWHALLQGIFPTQGFNPGLPHCRRILYCLSHQGSPEEQKKEGDKYYSPDYFALLKISR